LRKKKTSQLKLMLVTIDISGVQRLTRLAEQEFDDLGQDVDAIAQEAAQQELATKRYQRRTGDLEDGTEATFQRESGGWTVVLKQGMFYGVFVQALGYSDFEQIAEAAQSAIEGRIRAGERRLERA
jgi:hypothetical protein